MTHSLIGTDTATSSPVNINQSSRRQGLYIIGANGTGKTGLILNLVIQDIRQQLGVCVLDPHGDLTNDILANLPQERERDVILLDLADAAQFPFGLNLFTCSDINDPLTVDYTVDQVMHVFEKLFDVTRQTPLLMEYLSNCTYTIIYNQGYTMAEIPLLLQDATFRRKLVDNMSNIDIHLFWKQYESLRVGEQMEQASPILRRVREFLRPLSRPIIGQVKTTINLRHIMDERKILLVKLDNQLEAVTSLVGSVIIALILNAAYSRVDTHVNKRKQFNVYADEFQRFSTPDFATLLTEARKFGIATTIAHQTRQQIDEANQHNSLQAGSLICFRVTGIDGEELASSFNCKPPPALLDRREKVYVVAKTPLDFLLSLDGYPNSRISAFMEYARPWKKLLSGAKVELDESVMPSVYRYPEGVNGCHFNPYHVEKYFPDFFNQLFYNAMTAKIPHIVIRAGMVKAMAGLVGYGSHPGAITTTTGYGYNYPRHAMNYEAIDWFDSKTVMGVVYERNHYLTRFQPPNVEVDYFIRFLDFLIALNKFLDAIREEPIMVGRHIESCVTMYNEKALNPVQTWLPDFSALCHYTTFGMVSHG